LGDFGPLFLEREEMENPAEIIVTTRENPDAKVVEFGELFKLHQEESINSMMLLWNHNSYFVNSDERIFMINGGRKMVLEQLGECEFLYRRRNQFQMGMNAPDGNGGPKNKLVNWIIGVKERGTDTMVLLQIAEDGHAWAWLDEL
jgi:hypothetical protein